MAVCDSSILARWRRPLRLLALAGLLTLPTLSVAQTSIPYSFLACEPLLDPSKIQDQKFFIWVPCRTDVQLAPLSATTPDVLPPEPIPTPLTALTDCTAPVYILDLTVPESPLTAWVLPVAQPVIPPPPPPTPNTPTPPVPQPIPPTPPTPPQVPVK